MFVKFIWFYAFLLSRFEIPVSILSAVFKEVYLKVEKLPCEIIVLYGRIVCILRALCNISGMFLTYCINGFAQIGLQSNR